MSLWTPDGEHSVPRDPDVRDPDVRDPDVGDPDVGAEPAEDEDPLANLTPEEREQVMAMAEEMEEVRRQLAGAPASTVIANHLMGFYELAAIHLSQKPPHLDDARLAIDALGAVLENLAGRLGEPEPTLKDALGQIRLAYVQIHNATTGGPPAEQ